MKNIQLAADHKGMKVCLQGMIAQSCISVRDTALAFMLAQLENHLTELGKRCYAGDQTVVDEFLQLYCIEEEAREAVKQAKFQESEGG